MLEPLNLVDQQFEEVDRRAFDTRPRIRTGWPEFDALLNRGGFAPGHFVVFGGRTGTRKTATVCNIIVNMLRDGVPVALVGLDEQPPAQYLLKLYSAMAGISAEAIEEGWKDAEQVRQDFKNIADGKFVLSQGTRPTRSDLHSFLDATSVGSERPQVVFLDYISLMVRDPYAGAEVQRMQRLVEDLQIFTAEAQVVTIALHQIGRVDENSSKRNHGHIPLALESLKYAGEEIADLVLGSFRPARDPIGNMTPEQAEYNGIEEEEWEAAKARVQREIDNTYLQLLKNRPGTRLHEQGIRLRSIGDSQRMVVDE